MSDEVKMMKELNEQKSAMVEILVKLVEVQAETIKTMRAQAIDKIAMITQLQSEAIEHQSVDETLDVIKRCVAHVNALESQLCDREADVERREQDLERRKIELANEKR